MKRSGALKNFRIVLLFSLASKVSVLFSSAFGKEPETLPQGHLLPSTISLSQEERDWVKEHPSIRVGVDPEWPPFSFWDKDGVCKGIDIEILGLLLARCGLHPEFVRTSDWSQVLDLARKKEIDLVSGLSINEERSQYLTFTRPYFTYPVSIVTRNEEPFFMTPCDLFGRKVVMPRDYITTKYLEKNYPEIPMKIESSISENLESVSRGRSDATIVNLVVANYIIQRQGYSNLKISGVLTEHFDLHYGINKENEMLARIVNRAMERVTEQEISKIVGGWVTVDYGPLRLWVIYSKWIWAGLLVTFVLLVLIILKNRQLKEAMREREIAHAKLDESLERLHEMNVEKTKILYTVTHDLRNPIATLKLNNELTLSRLQVASKSEIEESFEIIGRQIEHMSHLVESILSLSAIEDGVRQPQWQSVEIQSLFKEINETHQIQASQKSLKFKVEPPLLPLTIESDPTMLRQIIGNFLSNAFKYTSQGRMIEMRAEVFPKYVRISVRDEGPGLDLEDQGRLFKKFTRLKSKTDIPSSGLGLSIAKGLTIQLGGEIGYESKLGEGSCFYIDHPISRTVG